MEVIRMRINKITIYGFGKWVDYSIDFSSESLICLYGENESGKSTIQQFILFMLFGLPPKKRAFYRPKTSGKMGGRLTIDDQEIGEYTIERLDEVNNGAATCYVADGKQYSEHWLRKQLKGMTSNIYQSIFSFSALDLNGFSVMKDEDLGEVLLGIGLTGSNNIYEIEKQLDQKIGKLFKPTGTVPVINKQLKKLEDQFSKLTEAKNNEATYQTKQEEVYTYTKQMNQLQTKLEEIKEKQRFIEKCQRNLSVIYDYHRYVEQLLILPQRYPFPENGLERLHTLQEQLLPFKSERSVLKTNEKEYEQTYEQLKLDLLEKDIYEKARNIVEKEQQFQVNQKEVSRLEELIHMLYVQINGSLQQLNIGLTIDILTQLSLSFYTETTWKALKNTEDQLHLEQEQFKREHETLIKQQHFLTRQLEDLNDQLLITEQQENLYTTLDMYKEHHYLEKATTETALRQGQWKNTKQSKERRMKLLLISSIVAGLFTCGLGIFLDSAILYYMMTIILVIGFGQWFLGKRTIQETTNLFASHEVITTPSIKVTKQEKQEAEELLENDDENRSMIRSMKDQLKAIDIQLIQSNEKQCTWNERRLKLDHEIDIQLDEYPFLKQINVKHWPEFFHTLKKLLETLSEKQNYEYKMKAYENNIMKYHEEIQGFLKLFNDDLLNASLEVQLKLVKDMIIKYDDSKRTFEQYDQMITENKVKQTDILQKEKIYEQEIQELFTIAEVDTADEFYKRENANRERETIEKELKKVMQQLQAVFSKKEKQQLMNQKPDEDQLTMEHEHMSKKSETFEKSIQMKRQHIADVHADLRNMETSENHSHIMHHFTMEKEQLKTLAKEWSILKTAQEMLAETKRNYRDKYLTNVIEQTSIYFKKITGNKYNHVIPPMDGQPFQVETADRFRYEVGELSQGTIDQLYICLRLAISEIMSEKHHLPFIIDDAFVHFDETRTKRMIDILSTIADKQQVIIFTCKTDVKSSLSKEQTIHLNETDHLSFIS